MKLKDILAQKLKAWPEGSLAATQDGDGEISHQSESGYPQLCESLDQWKAGPGRLCIFSNEKLILAEDYETAIVTRAEWQAAVDALNADDAAELKWPDGATHFQDIVFGTRPVFWTVVDGVALKAWRMKPDKVTVDETYTYSSEGCPTFNISKCIKRQIPNVAEWSEDGLPNVGTKCVVYKGSYNLLGGQEDFIGPVVTVTARFKSARGIEMACVDSGGDGGCHVFRADMCFHLPTAEEIAAKERDKAGCDLFCTINWNDRALTWERLSNNRKSDYLKAIDAGWQKVTK